MHFAKTRTFGSQDSSLHTLIANQRRDTIGTSVIGKSREVILTIKGYNEFIRLAEGAEYELGRYEEPGQNQLNLTPYGALECGLSRQHAKLYLLNERLYLADMGSTNGTYLRGYMLEPAQPTMVRNGDEILLGRMKIKVQF